MSGIDWILAVINILLLLALVSLIRGNFAMAESVARLQEEVAENQSAIDSAITLINGLVNRLREALMAEDSLDQVSALADELDAGNQRLAAAVAANTLAENDSEEFDVSELDEEDGAGESGEFDTPSDPTGSIEPESNDADTVDSSTDVSPAVDEDTTRSDAEDTVSAVDVANESEATEPNAAEDGEDDGEAETLPAA